MSENKCKRAVGAHSEYGCECQRLREELQELRAYLKRQEEAEFVPHEDDPELDLMPEDLLDFHQEGQ